MIVAVVPLTTKFPLTVKPEKLGVDVVLKSCGVFTVNVLPEPVTVTPYPLENVTTPLGFVGEAVDASVPVNVCVEALALANPAEE